MTPDFSKIALENDQLLRASRYLGIAAQHLNTAYELGYRKISEDGYAHNGLILLARAASAFGLDLVVKPKPDPVEIPPLTMDEVLASQLRTQRACEFQCPDCGGAGKFYGRAGIDPSAKAQWWACEECGGSGTSGEAE